MPEVVSVGLGGGTKIFEQGGVVTVGPESTGHRLLQEGLVFGGNTLTTTGEHDGMNLIKRCDTD
jgi:N-methylhydantoinase A/oxoprolinase/acetone carboxylase beta subunit